jgi:uncharacterized protein (TIGR03437 family)
MKRVYALQFLVLASSLLRGQVPEIAGHGFFSPVRLPATPGEILTIYVTGIAGVQESSIASSFPLPFTLQGVSITMTQAATSVAVQVPLLAVFPASGCATAQGVACSQLTGITLEMPFELVPNSPVAARPPNSAQLKISQGGQTTLVDIDPQSDRIHILRSGDTITQLGFPPAVDTPLLQPIVTHANGTLVSQATPAHSGEILVLYAVGLGRTTPMAVTGENTSGGSVAGPVTIAFDFLAGTGTAQPPNEMPSFSGLAPGFSGLYQINFTVPPSPTTLQVCTPGGPIVNFTIILFGPISRDAVSLCVAPPQTPIQ